MLYLPFPPIQEMKGTDKRVYFNSHSLLEVIVLSKRRAAYVTASFSVWARFNFMFKLKFSNLHSMFFFPTACPVMWDLHQTLAVY